MHRFQSAKTKPYLKNMCYQPITIKTPQGYRTVPCGHCLECLRKYQSDWSNRMYEELKSHNGKAVFFTLTYDDNNVPKNYLYYATATDYVLFRSPTDYGYDNTYTDEKGKERVLPSAGRERKHRAVSPRLELQEAGLDLDNTRFIDFNITRQDGIKFREQIQNIYGNYLRNFDITDGSARSDILECSYGATHQYNFDEYEGPDFLDPQTDNEELMLDLFTDVLNDDDPIENTDGHSISDIAMECNSDIISSCEAAEKRTYRDRPIMQFNSVRKKDVQDWIKRARRRREYNHKKHGADPQEFSFFITAEYGPRTLRPHYHGVIFGLSAKESADMKADWIRHHGRKIQWEDVDLSKGDMSYCAKYCSKGFFEHPLCSKDFFYMKPHAEEGERPFTEYHSKHYERCIEIFNVDAPIVDRPFKLISKGLGIDWVEDHKDLTEDFQDIDFKDIDVLPSVKVAFTPKDPDQVVTEYIVDNDFEVSVEDCERVRQEAIKYNLSLTKHLGLEDEHILKLNNKEEKTKDYAECIERLFNKFHYYRTFKGQTIAYGVPKYYRTKIFSDGLRSAFAGFVQQANVELYQEKFRQLQSNFPDGEDAEIVLSLEKQEEAEKIERMRNIYAKMNKLYNKSKI